MVRISDILKKTEKKKAEAEHPQSGAPASGSLPDQEAKSQPHPIEFKEKPIGEEKREPPSEKGVKIFETVMAKAKLLNEEEFLKLYKETISLVKEIYGKVKVGKEIIEADLENVVISVEKFVDQQYLNNDNIVNLITLSIQDYFIQDFFIYQHAVNVGIISIDVGLGLEYDKTKSVELGTIAMLHDIGMVKFEDLCNQPRRLNQIECKEIKNHPKSSAEIFEKFKNIYKKLVSVIYQEHERIDGSGYPLGLKEEAIDEYAKIIGPADMYEALVHARPHRPKMAPREALRLILENKNGFEKKIMKILIERLASPFPLGSSIKLSSGEEGRVIKRNLDCPLRPIVKVMHDAKGEKLEKPRIIDLAKCPTIHIKSALEG